MLRRVLLLLVLLSLLSGTAQARHLTIGMPFLNDSCRFPVVEAFFREAYSRVGMEADFLSLPSRLELEFADSGRTDASLLRTELVASEHRELVKVPYPLLLVDFVVCTLRKDIRISRVAELARYRVGVSRGDLTASMLCGKAGVTPVQVNSLKSGVRMMEEGRLDVILEERNTVELVKAQLGKPLFLSAPLHQARLYHWLNKRNAYLAGPLAEAFKAVIAEGKGGQVFGTCPAPSAQPR
ncbi:transporter substrate-binding domain-containing protein [uncultured Pseudodesulfovibrio sp.]|uniref:transporter substrate-binding domain-containing protein n=1 Tax=uncultured Pseudodesulfovibrio sp. TaxID=2035858 RepID=UPI0029C6247E|nr:transporter substrate-binding domain-containing protein [uncultured Pseudodesulfovibrio sp.]